MTIVGAARKIAGLFYDKGGAVVNVMHPDFGAKGDGVTDDTAAFNAALAAAGINGVIVLPPPTDTVTGYRVANVSQTLAGQTIIGYGARVTKNANGPILASSGDGVQIIGVQFRGESPTPVFTGDNVTFSGNNCAMLNAGSRWAFGRAVKATGSHFQILGTSDIYQTADATATGYDIEIGISGTATLYHELHGVYTSQPTGGILATDVGGLTMVGGEVGKVYFKAGTLPAGVGVNKVIGTRMTGAFTTEISNTVIAGGAFSAVSITFAAGTSGCSMDPSTVLGAGHVLTNSGNGAQPICQSIGAAGSPVYKHGDDASLATMTINPGSGEFRFPSLRIANNKNFYFENAAGNQSASLSESVAGDFTVSNPETNHAITYATAGTGSGSRHQWTIAGAIKALIDNLGFSPAAQTNGERWIQGSASELLTLSTVAAFTDTVANLLPANSIIEAVVARVVTGITVATDWSLGDPTTANRFAAANATMTAGATSTGLRHQQGSITTDAAGPVQTAAAKVRVTTTGIPGAGVIRIVVFYRQFIAPTS